MPPGTLVPRDWVLERLSDDPAGATAVEAPAPPARVDLTIRDLASLFGKQPSTVRGWVEHGDFPGCYKLHGKEWRVPASAVEEFQNRQRGTKSDEGLSAWRTVTRSYARERPETGQQPVATKSTRGNPEV
jgi:hypothetical protein